MQRYSSRRKGLDKDFINQKLQGAVSYDRIAGFFRSSILEVAGEALEKLDGKIRVVCNSDLSVQDVETAKAAQQAIRRSWCAGKPEQLPLLSHPRFARLFAFLSQGKMQVRVLPDEVFGLIHGKAGVITYSDGSKTSFLGSANESKTAWKLNYELVWEDESKDSIIWVQEEFDALWHHPQAVPLADFVVKDINRIAHRVEIDHQKWLAEPNPDPASAIVETPIYRQELGLWAHQKFFIKKAFEDHLQDGARYILADQVGLGKTVQLAVSELLMALHGDKPVLVIAPKPLVLQFHPIEAWDMLDILSRGSDRVFGNAWSNWRRASEVIPIVMGEESISENVHDAWNWLRNPFPPANEHRSFKGIRQRLRMEDSDFVIQGSDIDKLKRPDITKLHRVLHDYGRQYNPFIRHIVRRTRTYLENTIDESTGEPYLKPVSVRLFGEDNQEKDPKYQEVKQYLIARDWLGKGCIIFSQYYDSVMWLATQLSSEDLPEERIGISSRLEEIHGLFGQIPDVLQDAWVNIAIGEEELAKKLIDKIKPKHPFDERYSKVESIDWESCSQILNESEKLSLLQKGW